MPGVFSAPDSASTCWILPLAQIRSPTGQARIGEQHQHRDHAGHAALADADVVAAAPAPAARGDERARGSCHRPRRHRPGDAARCAPASDGRGPRSPGPGGPAGWPAAAGRRPAAPTAAGWNAAARPTRCVPASPTFVVGRAGDCCAGRTPVPPGKTVYGYVVRCGRRRRAFRPSDAVSAADAGNPDAGRLRVRGPALLVARRHARHDTRTLAGVTYRDGVVGAGPPAHALGREAGRYPDARHVVVGLLGPNGSTFWDLTWASRRPWWCRRR